MRPTAEHLELRDRAQQWRRAADRIRDLSHQLRVRARDMQWEGPAAVRFRERVARQAREAESAADRLDAMAVELERHAQQPTPRPGDRELR